NVAGAVGLAVALESAERERARNAESVALIRDAFTDQVLARIASARVTGHPVHRLPGHASFTFAGTSGEAVLLELERRGVITSSGSACAAGSDEPSHVLLACAIAPELAQTAVRFTLDIAHKMPLDGVVEALVDAVKAVSDG